MDIPKIAISGKEIQLWAQKLYLLLLLIRVITYLISWPHDLVWGPTGLSLLTCFMHITSVLILLC